MKKTVSLLLVVIMALSLCACSTDKKAKETTKNVTKNEESKETKDSDNKEDSDGNLLKNGDFSNDITGWGTYFAGGNAKLTVKEEQGIFSIGSTGRKEYAVQLYYDGFELKQGGKYRLEFDAVCSEERQIEVRIQINGGDYHPYVTEKVDLTKKLAHYSYDFEMKEATDKAPRLCFNCGSPDGEPKKNQEITYDNVALTLVDDSGVVKEENTIESKSINLNQVGYRPTDSKKVIFRTIEDSEKMDTTFDVVDESGKVVYTGDITGENVNVTADEKNYYGDFSKVQAEGTYKIVTKNFGESYNFQIADNVYDDSFNQVIHMLYLQRCGSEITKEYGSDFSHPVCHSDKAVIYGTKKTLDVSGGWHDAGDYGRYICPGAKTVADLLLAYQNNKGIFLDNTNIPESGNGVPDVLDEARYELDWMLKMQDKKSGGVYHKVTCLAFPGEVSPEEETDQLVIAPISLTATGDFSAVMAMAYENYKDIDAKFAKTCLSASKKAYEYLMKNEDVDGFRNPKDIITGEYPDRVDTDERYWAACQLYKATGLKNYKTTAEKYIKSSELAGLGWADMGTYGTLAYLDTTNTTDKTCIDKLKKEVLAKSDLLTSLSSSDGYGISIGSDYVWGSNMSVLNNAMMLLFSYKISGDEKYKNAAYDHLNYIFGANPNSICFVTGFGSVSPQNTHHRPSMAVGSCMPGMLVGGPDSKLEDPYIKNVLADAPAAKCYADNAQSYSSNEVAIYWNSPLIYVMSVLEK